MVSIKICGLTSEEAVQAVIAARADYAGFIYFARSPRHLTFARAAELKKLLPASIKSVSVLVDPDDMVLHEMQNVLAPDYVQLHGKETPARVADIRREFPQVKIIKAISVKSGDDVAKAAAYTASVDMLMFDAKPPSLPSSFGLTEGSRTDGDPSIEAKDDKTYLPGGNGLSFDWALLKDREFQKPWFLSGGLNPDNVVEAIRQTGAKMVDVSSGVEKAAGVKDPALIERFVKAARITIR